MKTFKIVALIIALVTINTCFAQELISTESKFIGKPIVEMTLNGKKIWALLDTGSEYTILNIATKNRFKYDSYKLDRAKYKIQGLGTELNHMYTIRKAEISFHEVKLEGNILAYDISNIVSSIKTRTGKTITAIIGTKMMRHHGFVIDMGTDKVVMNIPASTLVSSHSLKLSAN